MRCIIPCNTIGNKYQLQSGRFVLPLSPSGVPPPNDIEVGVRSNHMPMPVLLLLMDTGMHVYYKHHCSFCID